MGFSWLYFSSSFSHAMSESNFFNIFDILLSLPALIMFGYGFGDGQAAMLKAGFYLFLIIWFVSFLLTYLIQTIRQNNRKAQP